MRVKNNSGFSFMEVVVVVAILAILSGVAVPSFIESVRKAKQAESKSNLASLYSSMKAFFGEYSRYNNRLDGIGYRPDGQLVYRVGFAGDLAPPVMSAAIVRKGTVTCLNTGATAGNCSAGFKTWTEDPQVVARLPSGMPMDPRGYATNIFEGYAVGWLGSAVLDSWSIDEKKQLRNMQNGI